jgi:hypothetical protein
MLQSPLVLHAWATRQPASGRVTGRGGAHEMRRVDLDLIAPARPHLLERLLRALQ